MRHLKGGHASGQNGGESRYDRGYASRQEETLSVLGGTLSVRSSR